MKRTIRLTSRIAGRALLAALIAAGIAACMGRSTPPGANRYLGYFEHGGFLFLRWQEGMEIMIWYDVTGSAEAHGTGSTEDPIYVERGSARSADGRSLEWEVQTRDGKTGEVRIGSASYDPSAGTLFIVTTRGGTTDVRQLDRDLSAVPFEQEGILAFAENDPDLSAFLNASGGSP